MNGIQPTWLSAYAILMSGNRASVPEKTQSASEPSAFCAYMDMEVASGASGDVVGIDDDAPTWMDAVLCLSSRAAHRTSQSPEYIDGQPSSAGLSLNVIA